MSKAQKEREPAVREQDERITDKIAKIRNFFMVMSGKGGVGKSTIAINLAVEMAQRGFKVGLMDVDLHALKNLFFAINRDSPIRWK